MKMLFSAYRLDQYPDPDGFMAQTALLLSDYPEGVVIYVTDPRTGIQRCSKWPPTIAEVTAACDAQVVAIAREKSFADWRERKRISDEIIASRPRKAADYCKPGEVTYGEFIKQAETLQRSIRPIGRFEAA